MSSVEEMNASCVVNIGSFPKINKRRASCMDQSQMIVTGKPRTSRPLHSTPAESGDRIELGPTGSSWACGSPLRRHTQARVSQQNST